MTPTYYPDDTPTIALDATPACHPCPTCGDSGEVRGDAHRTLCPDCLGDGIVPDLSEEMKGE